MPDIKGQLIKNSYNYVLQSDLITGIIYRIGGDVPNNPKFISGLTVNANFTYSDGSEFPGYVLTCDSAGNAVWGPVSGATSGVVVTGGTFDYSAGTLTLGLSNGVNVPISGLEDIYVTGGIVSGNSIVFSYNDTNTFEVSGITSFDTFTSYTASTETTINNKLDTSGFTAYTASTQPLILNSVTGGTFSGGTLYLINNSGATIPISGFTTGGTSTTDTFVTGFTLSSNTITLSQNRTDSYSSFTISLSAYTGSSVSGDYLPLSGGTVTGGTIFQSGLTANTISATTYDNLPTDVFVTGGTYTSGNVIFRNNAGGTFTVTGFAVGGGEGQPFYLNISQSKNGNRYLSTTASTAAEQSTGVTINNGGTGTIASFQSDQLGITLIPGGVWAFYLHSYKSNSNASFDIFVEVYKRTSGGTETLLFTTDPTAVTSNSPNPSMQLSDGYFSGCPLVVSDSIVAKVRATNTSNQSHVITLFSEGSQHYSYAISTLPTQQGLTCDTISGCGVINTIQTDITNLNTNKLDKSGGTISGDTIFQSGLTADTISATTYQNLPTPTLQQVTDVGNTTTNNIVLQNTAEAQFGSGGGILLANSARLREGTTDGLLGGAKGIAQICSNAYELKWEAGRLYVMEQNGFTIREVRYQFNVKPVGTDDVDKGYVIGSRWVLDNGDLYVCSDNSQGLAVWEAQTICDELADCAVITGLTGDVQTIFSSITGTPNQVAYYNVSGKLTGDTNFTRLDETNNFTTGIASVNFSNVAEHQDTKFDYNVVRDRVYNDDVALVGESNLSPTGYYNIINNTTGNTFSGLDILETAGTFRYTDGAGNYNGFFYTDQRPGFSVERSGTQYNYFLPKSAFVTGGTLTDVSGDGNLTWVVPTTSTFTGGTVSGATRFISGLTANTISATTYQNLPTSITSVTESANVITVVNSNGQSAANTIDAVTGGTYSAGQITLSGTGNVNGTQISTKILPVALTVVSNTASTDASLSSLFTLTLTGNTTLATPTNGFSGQRIVYRLRQDGTGSKLLTLSSGFRSGPITVTLSTAANTTDYLGVIYNEIDNEWDVLALNKGYS